jgi:hypothetical protein
MTALFPFSAIEGLKRKTLEVHSFKTADVDIDLVRMRTRNVVRMNATNRAKIVFGGLGVELVEGYRISGSKQAELPRLDDQVEKPFLGANRTVAINYYPVQIGRNLESYLPAMASALIGWHRHLRSFQRSANSDQPDKI